MSREGVGWGWQVTGERSGWVASHRQEAGESWGSGGWVASHGDSGGWMVSRRGLVVGGESWGQAGGK